MNRTQYVNMYRRLARTRTKYAECIKITRMDGVVFRFTAHDAELSIWESDGGRYTYTPANSFELTALENQAGLVVSNMDINAIVDDAAITENDLIAGKFDHANVELFIAYWSNTQVQVLPLRTSWIGEVILESGSFKADLRGIAQKLAQVFVQTASLECRYAFCDKNYKRSYCGLDEATFTKSFTVTSVNSQSDFTVNMAAADYGLYKWGFATFTSGNNAGVGMEVIHNHTDRVGLFMPMPYQITVGDTVDLLQGCDKTYTTCKDRFGNLDNFGGEPFLAGSDLLASYKLLTFGDDGGKKSK